MVFPKHCRLKLGPLKFRGLNFEWIDIVTDGELNMFCFNRKLIAKSIAVICSRENVILWNWMPRSINKLILSSKDQFLLVLYNFSLFQNLFFLLPKTINKYTWCLGPNLAVCKILMTNRQANRHATSFY